MFFSAMDLISGYWQVELPEEEQEKCAMITSKGLFQPTRMPQGLCNAPATFQGFMNEIFSDLIDGGQVVIYLDDILIFAETRAQHDDLVRRVLEVLRQHKLYLRPEKCSFAQPTVEYLGHIIGNGEVRMDPAKVAAVRDWPQPKTKKELQQFLGFCNYYRRFVVAYSEVARPLHRLTGKEEWKWTEEQTQAFEKLKARICEEAVVAVPGMKGACEWKPTHLTLQTEPFFRNS